MVSVLDIGVNGPGSSPNWLQCVVFLGNTLLSKSLSTQLYKWVLQI